VCAYDIGYSGAGRGRDLPVRDAITVSRTTRGGLILPITSWRAGPPQGGRIHAGVEGGRPNHVAGRGVGTVNVKVVNSNDVPEAGHLFKVSFTTPSPDSLRARLYTLTDSTAGKVLVHPRCRLRQRRHRAGRDGLMPFVRPLRS